MTTAERSLATTPIARVDVAAGPDAPRSDGRGRSSRPVVRTMVLAGGAYLVLSLGLWWHVWTGHPADTTTCGCGDSSLFQWFLAWPAYAISHGLDPWYSRAVFYPHGINLLSNTAVVGVGIVLAPVTWLFGPIATFNAALGLAPVLSALAMFVLLRRWVAWSPAAFFGGLLYGFSPFILIGLTDGHLMLSMAPMPPLLVLCLDELVARQRRSPVVGGVLLGLVVAVQFFIGTEVLILVAIGVAIGVVLLLLYGALHRDVLARHVRHTVTGLAWAAATAAVLLAYPTWFALAGPAHLSGPIWGDTPTSYGGTNFHDYFLPGQPSVRALSIARVLGGYQALTLSGQYLGLGLVVVLGAGLILWRKDLRLWLFAIVGVTSVPLSMGLSPHETWTLWSVFVHLPLMDDVIPSRFLIVTYLCAAIMLGLIVDHARAGVSRWLDGRGGAVGGRPSRPGTKWRRAGSFAALGVALVAVLPVFAYDADGLPFTTQKVVLPTWFSTVAPNLDSRQVVLTFPAPFAFGQSALTWQAVDDMSFSQVGGSGPGSILSRAGEEEAGQRYIGDISIGGARCSLRTVSRSRGKHSMAGASPWSSSPILAHCPATRASARSGTPSS